MIEVFLRLWTPLEKNTESPAFQACLWLEQALAPHRRGLTAGQYLMQNSLHKIKIYISSAQLKRE